MEGDGFYGAIKGNIGAFYGFSKISRFCKHAGRFCNLPRLAVHVVIRTTISFVIVSSQPWRDCNNFDE